MVKDIDISHFYKKFIEASNDDIKKYKSELKTINNIKAECCRYINDKIDIITNTIGIDIKSYNYPNKTNIDELEKSINSKLGCCIGNNRIILLQLLKYCNIIKKRNEYNNLIELAEKRNNISLSDYKKYIKKYYNEGVHKCCLEGYAYHFGYGIGDVIINLWRYADKPRENYVDWDATRRKKQEILNAGLKLYNKEEAEIYKLRGIKYDGVPYVVYKTNKEFYNIELINTKIVNNNSIKFKYANYIPLNLRGKDAKQINNECKTEENIFKLSLGLRSKLLVYLEHNINNQFKYIRNAEQYKYKRGAHNCKNRQRFQS